MRRCRLFFFLPVCFALLCRAAGEDDHLRMRRLLDWGTSRGAAVNLIRPQDKARSAEDGRALYTTVPVKKGTILMFVPSKLLITDVVARRSPLLAKYAFWMLESEQTKQTLEAPWFVCMFIFLENVIPGQRQASTYAPYYESLPTFDFDFNIPLLFWKKTKIGREALNILMTPEILNTKQRHSGERYQSMLRLMEASKGVFEAVALETGLQESRIKQIFLWATSIVISRAWATSNLPIKGACALVPIVDMVNHEEEAEGLVGIAIEPNRVGVGIVTKKNLSAAVRVFGNYDAPGKCDTDSSQCRENKQPACAESLLFSYGFLLDTPDENDEAHGHLPARSYCVDLSLSLIFTDESPIHRRRRSALEAFLAAKEVNEFHAQDSMYALRLREGHPGRPVVPPNLLAILRISEADNETLDMVQDSTSEIFMRPVNGENERRVLDELAEFFSGVLKRFPGHENEDMAMRRVWEHHAAAIDSVTFEGEAARIRDASLKGYMRMVLALRVRTRRRRLLGDALAWVKSERTTLR